MIAGLETTVNVKVAVEYLPKRSATLKMIGLGLEGTNATPEIVAPEGSSVRPAGKEPDTTDHT